MKLTHNYHNLVAWIVLWACVLFVAVRIVQACMVDVCRVPTSSMEDAILEGDRIVVSKIGRDIINRNDIIVFNHPDGGGTQLVKRCVGLPGDTVSLRQGMVYINGQAVATPPTVKIPSTDYSLNFPRRNLGWTINNYGPVITPATGTTIMTDSVNLRLYHHVFWTEGSIIMYADSLYTFYSDCYFVLGDNRSNSIDSRYWGFVPKELVLGKAVMVYFSRVGSNRNVRWDRIGKRIR